MKIGDYVLATKFSDGDSKDHFCVGILERIIHYSFGDRYIVVDKEGIPFRANGFRRCERIGTKRGNWIVQHIKFVETSFQKVWFWKKANWKILNRISKEF